MRWNGMPMAMWAVFAKSFEKQLTEVLGYDAKTAKAIRKTAKLKYSCLPLLIFLNNTRNALAGVKLAGAFLVEVIMSAR